MKAAELRVGNYVNFKDGWYVDPCEILTITNFRKYFCHLQYDRKSHHLIGGFTGRYVDELEPIPLTEEWLLKFGFENIDTNVNGGDNFWCLSRPDFILNRSFQSYQMNTGVDLKHVHQLQNLYYALTNEELKIIEDEN